MANNIFTRLFSSSQVDPETLSALRWKMPSALSVSIHEDPSGKYVATIHNPAMFKRALVTEGATGQELFDMVNDIVFTVLDIPEGYRQHMGNFLPPDNVRQELAIKIPRKYLDKEIGLVRA